MKRKLFCCWLFLVLGLLLEGSGGGSILASAATLSPSVVLASHSFLPYHACKPVMEPQKSHNAICHAIIERAYTGSAVPGVSGTPPYTPADLHNFYQLPYTASGSPTVAIVTAYDNPNVEADLAVYRTRYNLPACTFANACFLKLNQNGGFAPLPTGNIGWGQESSLDLDMVSAICTNCRILLIEANSSDLNDLGSAVNAAISLGATVVSNSYGSQSGEFSSEGQYCDRYFNHKNVAITASSGDYGPGVTVPAACPYVTAVGGTSLKPDGSETVWKGAGGGCSQYISKPSWQRFFNTGCSNRAVADVSAIGDPYTGVSAYDSYGTSGWLQMGGTSASAPIIAGVYALAGNAGVEYAVSLAWQIENESFECLDDVPGPEAPEYAYQVGLGTPIGTFCL